MLKEQLWRVIRMSTYLLGVLLMVKDILSDYWLAEVPYLQIEILVKKQILRLQIPVYDVVLMEYL